MYTYSIHLYTYTYNQQNLLLKQKKDNEMNLPR